MNDLIYEKTYDIDNLLYEKAYEIYIKDIVINYPSSLINPYKNFIDQCKRGNYFYLKYYNKIICELRNKKIDKIIHCG